MKYTPKPLRDNVNVSKTHPLAELAWMVGGLVLITGLVFFALGWATDLAVSKTPIEVEQWLGRQALKQFPGKKNDLLQARLDGLLTSLPPESPLHDYTFTAYLSESQEVNAIALPGGNIVIFSGLLHEIESENELAMILFHELGHFSHRDHLRGLGRGLGITVASVIVLGGNSAASEVLSKTVLSFQAKYSRTQEAAADHFALESLDRYYGHVAGSTDFFVRLAQKSIGRLPYLLASHPHPQDRITALEELITSNGYILGTTVPLQPEVEDLASSNHH